MFLIIIPLTKVTWKSTGFINKLPCSACVWGGGGGCLCVCVCGGGGVLMCGGGGGAYVYVEMTAQVLFKCHSAT